MKLTVILDNNTLIDRYFIGEPGVSYYIEEEDTKILFDVGYSNAFIENAQKMNINLLKTDYIVLSHGHSDHTWGLIPLIKLYSEAKQEKKPHSIPTLISHPLAFLSKSINNGEEIGSIIGEDNIKRHFKTNLNTSPIWITKNIVFLGEIERKNDYENKVPIGKVYINNKEEEDYLKDDSALVYKSKKGLVIITGCSHAGICNIIEYAKKVCNEERVIDVIGGFHLLDPNENQLRKTVKYFKDLNLENIHPCHCTDLKSKIELSKSANIHEVGVSDVLEY